MVRRRVVKPNPTKITSRGRLQIARLEKKEKAVPVWQTDHQSQKARGRSCFQQAICSLKD